MELYKGAYMPVFYILVGIGAVALWFLCSFLYRPLGGYFKHIFKDSYDAITEENEKKENIEK